MVVELSSEEVVTRLLNSHEVLRVPVNNGNFFGENSKETLGEYLMSVPPELTQTNTKNNKYIFITQ